MLGKVVEPLQAVTLNLQPRHVLPLIVSLALFLLCLLRSLLPLISRGSLEKIQHLQTSDSLSSSLRAGVGAEPQPVCPLAMNLPGEPGIYSLLYPRAMGMGKTPHDKGRGPSWRKVAFVVGRVTWLWAKYFISLILLYKIKIIHNSKRWENFKWHGGEVRYIVDGGFSRDANFFPGRP